MIILTFSKKLIRKIIPTLLITLTSTFAYTANASVVPENSELNWYFVNRGKDTLPEGPKESVNILKDYDAYYLGDTESKVIYLTFDEGYENGYTSKILDVLKESYLFNL